MPPATKLGLGTLPSIRVCRFYAGGVAYYAWAFVVPVDFPVRQLIDKAHATASGTVKNHKSGIGKVVPHDSLLDAKLTIALIPAGEDHRVARAVVVQSLPSTLPTEALRR